MSRAVQEVFENVVVLAAVGSIAYGAWLVLPPLGFMVGGVLVLAVAIVAKVRNPVAAPQERQGVRENGI
jgi:hypothetical protein